MSLLVFGHKNPDTDSICSAISLAHLKNQIGVEATPYALGEVRKEAQYALDYFGVKAPEVLEDVKIQVKDLSYDKVKSLKPSDSVLNAYNTMIEKGTKTLPVVSADGKFQGIITMVEIAKSLMYQHFRKVNIPLENVCYNLKGEVLVQCNDVFDGRVTTLSYGMEEIMNLLSEGDIAIVGNRYDIIEYAIVTRHFFVAELTRCIWGVIILTGKATLNDELTALAKANGVTVISVDVDTYTASNLINQCAEIEDIITRENLVLFNENDYVDDVKETMLSTNFRAYPVIDNDGQFLGLVSRRHLLNPTKKNVILVDHNEFAQSADGIEQANIVEIVDHHKIGGISTDLPISVRVAPVGCCSTIVYNLYKEHKVEVPKHIAGLLLSAILSDTLIFKSPTTTELDKKAVLELAEIAGVDYEAYGMDMFKAGTSLEGFSIEEIVNMDFKEFNMSGNRVGIGQVMTLDIDSILNKKDEYLSYINGTDYDMLVLAITDIIKEGSYLLYKANDSVIAEAFNVDANQGVFAEGVVSRKKQLVPNLTNAVKNM